VTIAMSSRDGRVRRAAARARSDTNSARKGSPKASRRLAGHERERVNEVQRGRLLAAVADVVAERGFPQVTVAHIVARSGVSRRTFYDLFEDREEAFLAAFDHAIKRAAATVIPAYERPERWRERVRAGLATLLQFLDEEPELGRLVVVDALAAGHQALQRRTRVLDALIATVDEGRTEAKAGHEPPPLTAEGTVGAVLAIIHARLLERDPEPLTGLTGSLMGMIVLPYLGPGAAQKELARPNTTAHKRSRRGHRDPLEGLDMRLTYRTIRVLMAIAAQPGASNRQVADHAGVGDQGQISKLLARLQTLGLIENTGQGQTKGEPNAWVLTHTGRQVERAIRTEAGS
jgi:AcrR family transcriptional regulator/DNA-binding MarR family transcriptional regulator